MKRKQSSQVLTAAMVASVVILVGLVVGLGGWAAWQRIDQSADQAAVRALWHEYAVTSKIEEVRWWPARIMEQRKADHIKWLGKRIKELTATIEKENPNSWERRLREDEKQQAETELKTVKQNPAPRVLRVKFRTVNVVSELRDEAYEIRDGKARPVKGWMAEKSDFLD